MAVTDSFHFFVLFVISAVSLNMLFKHFDIRKNGFFASAIAFFCMMIFIIPTSFIDMVVPDLFYLTHGIFLFIGCFILLHWVCNIEADKRKSIIKIWFFTLYITDLILVVLTRIFSQ